MLEDIELNDSLLNITRARLPWLIVGLIGGLFGAKVIGVFDLKSNYELAFFIPLIAPNTGTCQFFINLVDNTYLDFDKPPFTSKHPVFGITVSGFNIVEDIGDVQTNFNDKPYIDVIMDSVRIVTNQTNTDFINIENKPNLVKIVDILGRDSYPQKNIPLIYIYDSGEVRKVILK